MSSPPRVIVAGGAGNIRKVGLKKTTNKPQSSSSSSRRNRVVNHKQKEKPKHEIVQKEDSSSDELLIGLLPKNEQSSNSVCGGNQSCSNDESSSSHHQMDSKVVVKNPITAIDLLSGNQEEEVTNNNNNNSSHDGMSASSKGKDVEFQEDEKKGDDFMQDIPMNNNNDDDDPESYFASETHKQKSKDNKMMEHLWLAMCFLGIMVSFVCYGLLLELSTSGDEPLHELSFLFVTSLLYTMTAAAGRYVRDEKPTTVPPARFAILGLTSMGSTFCSVRSLRFVIYPIQVLAKSCKPVPVMIMGAFMGKKYPLRKYFNVALIVAGVGMFMGGGHSKKKTATIEDGDESSSPSQFLGILLLFISLCFDGGTGAYEDKLMSVHEVGPFDLMYNIQLGKTIIAGVGLLVFNQVHVFLHMCQDMGFLLVALGISGAMGQVFIFVTIAKFGALTCSIIGLARKVTTLVASIYFYGHTLTGIQSTGLLVSVGAMIINFWGKSSGNSHHAPNKSNNKDTKHVDDTEPFYRDHIDDKKDGEIELGQIDPKTSTI